MRVTVPAPTAASLGKFGDVPVSLYTGVPDINIPLFTVKGRTLELPVTLRYHAGGIKVEEIGGWAGIGWALETGGTITRTVRGIVDEWPHGYYNTGHIFYDDNNWSPPPASVVQDLKDKVIDGEPDRFFFSFGGRSGQFAIGPTTTSSTIKAVRSAPHQNLRIVPVFLSYDIVAWQITTEDGTEYFFGAAETTTDRTTTSAPESDAPGHWGESHYSSWHLTEVRSVGGDTIRLYYSDYNARHRQGTSEADFRWIGYPSTCAPASYSIIGEYETTVQRLDSIKSAAHVVRFTSTLRTDALSPTNAQQEYRLDQIAVFTAAGKQVRRFKFEHDYLGDRLRLKSVTEQDDGGNPLPPYTFTYDGQTLPARTSYAQDHWGFYNGVTSNTTLLPAMLGPFGLPISGANRSPAAGPMKAGVLTRVTYPTGGFNEFVYEANDFGFGGSLNEEGPEKWTSLSSSGGQGPRTQQFTIGGTQSITATVTVTTNPAECWEADGPCPWAQIEGVGIYDESISYNVILSPGTYTLNASDEWRIDASVYISIQWREKWTTTKKTAGGLRVAEMRTANAMGDTVVRRYKYTLASDTTVSSGVVNSDPIYHYQFSGNYCGHFSRSSMSKVPLGSGSPVVYREVTVWDGANGEFGKTRHTFFWATDGSPSGFPFSSLSNNSWSGGRTTGVTEYNASGQVQRRVSTDYNMRSSEADSAFSFRGLSINVFTAGPPEIQYVYHQFYFHSDWMHPSVDSTFVFDQAGSQMYSSVKTTAYASPVHMQPTEIKETNSDGTERITRMKYAADYANGSGNPEAIAITTMKGSAHMPGVLLERWVTQKTGGIERVAQAELTTFRLNNGRPLPYQRFTLNDTAAVSGFTASAISTSFTKDSRYLLQETADSADAFGRVRQLTDARGKVTKYQYTGTNTAFLTKITRVKDGTGTIDLVTDLAYDNLGNVSSIRDEAGTFQYFGYDSFGRLRHIRNHSGDTIKAFGYSYSRTLGNNWTFQSSSPNFVVDTTYVQRSPSVTRVVSWRYLDGLGRPIQTSVQDSTNRFHVTAQQYDAMGREWRTWRPYSRTSAAYDASFATNATSFYNTYLGVSNAKPYTETRYTPDALNRPSTTYSPYLGTSPTDSVRYAYGLDAAPKQSWVEITDESGNKTRSYKDLFGNEVKTVRGAHMASPSTTVLGYNVLGQRIHVTDPRNLVITYGVNTRGLLVRRTSPDAGTVQHKYDVAGNARFTQDAVQAAAGTVLVHTYDFAGRPLVSGVGSATFTTLNPDAAPGTLETTSSNWHTVRTYDAKPTNTFPWSSFWTQINPLTLSNAGGRLAAMASKSNGAWQVTLYSYDANGGIAATHTFTQNDAATAVLTAINTTTTYERDLRGEVTKRSTTVGSSTFNHWYDYNGSGLLWKVFTSTSSTKPGSADVTYTFGADGSPASRQFAGDASIPLRYTIRGQLHAISSLTSSTTPFAAQYTWNPNGTVQITEFRSNGSPHTNKRYRYSASYDGKNQLTAAQYAFHNGTSYTSSNAYGLGSIAYDLSGNLSTLTRYRESATVIDTVTYTTAGSSNRLNSISDAIGATGETWDVETGSFTYDANGNMKTAPAPYGITGMTYDHANLPVSITSNAVTSTYRYNTESQRIAKKVGPGHTEVYILEGRNTLSVFSVNAAGSVTGSHFNILAGGKVVGRLPSGGIKRFYHTDMLGSTRAVVENGSIVESYDYDSWGVLMPGRTLGGATKERFTGKERDETGLDYFGFRYYMSSLGRWNAVDPAVDKYGAWSTFNYAFNAPLMLTDPDGRDPDPCRSNPMFCYGVAKGALKSIARTVTGVLAIASVSPNEAAANMALDSLRLVVLTVRLPRLSQL